MPQLPDCEVAIDRGVAFLAKQQQADGSFLSYSSASRQPFRRLRSWQTTFVPALMLASLAHIETRSAMRIRRQLAHFLLRQKDANWSFNYWARGAPERKSQPYPNDLDDTFCALAGLYLHDPGLLGETAMADIVKLLLAAESAVGGPYRTWLVAPDSKPVWLDTDTAVNSNIAYFLSLEGHRLPNLNSLMSEAIRKERFVSPYYPSPYAFGYYFARAYEGSQKGSLLRQVRRLHNRATTDLERALCLSARLRLGDEQPLGDAVSALLTGQRRDGSWAAAAFYADPVKNGKLYYNGAAALTTAFALEALRLFQRARLPSPPETAPKKRQKQVSSASVIRLAREQSKDLEPTLRAQLTGLLRKQASDNNGDEIIGLARSFNQSLRQPIRRPDIFFERLGLANLYGWLAYTIYDDFLDGAGKPSLLPAANLALRRSLDGFDQVIGTNSFGKLTRTVFDTIDSANAWEQNNCRFDVTADKLRVGVLPDYSDLGQLAERSLGHTLAPLAVLLARGMNPSDDAYRQLRLALRHYLIVRQLNDDLHDWQEDLLNGHISYVVGRLLSGLGVKRRAHLLPPLINQARRHFWHHTLPAISLDMRRHTERSRRALEASKLCRATGGIHALLDEQEATIQKTLASQQQTVNFLKHYKKAAL